MLTRGQAETQCAGTSSPLGDPDQFSSHSLAHQELILVVLLQDAAHLPPVRAAVGMP